MDAVAAAFEAYPREGFLPPAGAAPGGVRRADRDRPRPDQQPAADRGRDAAAARRPARAAGARRRRRVGLDHRAAGPPHRARRARCSGWSWSRTWCEFGSANLARTGPAVGVDPAGRAGRARAAGRGAVRPDPGLRGAARRCPTSWSTQLADDGVMVIPVAGTMLRVTNPGARRSPGTAATGSCPSAEVRPRGAPRPTAAPAGRRRQPGRAHRLAVRPDDREDAGPHVVGDHVELLVDVAVAHLEQPVVVGDVERERDGRGDLLA